MCPQQYLIPVDTATMSSPARPFRPARPDETLQSPRIVGDDGKDNTRPSRTRSNPVQQTYARATQEYDSRGPAGNALTGDSVRPDADFERPSEQRRCSANNVGDLAGVELPTEPLNVIILGASFGGLSCAHYFLDHTIRQLGITSPAPSYRLIVVAPSTHIYWNIGAPRALVRGGLLKHEDTFIAIEPGFQRHRGLPYTIIQGKAVNVDPTYKTVEIDLFDYEAQRRCSYLLPERDRHGLNPSDPASKLPSKQILPYHALILCTGTSAHSDLLSLHGPHLETANALNRFHAQVTQAKSIVVVGGGTSGVEVAGQLATFLNYKRHIPFPVRVKNPKKVILITGGDRCLPGLAPNYGTQAEKMLRKLGVEVKHNVRVSKAQEWFDQTGATRVDLSDETQIIADVYVACTGVAPNSHYAPPHMKDEHGYITTNGKTMRCDTAGERVYSVGDVASYSQNYVPDVYNAVPVVMHNLLNDLLKYELQLASPYGGNDDKIESLVDETYAQRTKDSQLCPVSRFGGVGILMGMKLPAPMVHVLKGHDYRVCKAKFVVVDGGNPYAAPVPGAKYR